jgi:hypothetical protein
MNNLVGGRFNKLLQIIASKVARRASGCYYKYIEAGVEVAQSVKRLAKDWKTEKSEPESRQGQHFLSLHRKRVPGALSPGPKLPGLEADHSTPTSTEVKKALIHTSTSPHTLMVQYPTS